MSPQIVYAAIRYEIILSIVGLKEICDSRSLYPKIIYMTSLSEMKAEYIVSRKEFS